MFGIVAAALAEGTSGEGTLEGAEEHAGITVPIVLGVSTFLILLLLLFVVTRFNPDR